MFDLQRKIIYCNGFQGIKPEMFKKFELGKGKLRIMLNNDRLILFKKKKQIAQVQSPQFAKEAFYLTTFVWPGDSVQLVKIDYPHKKHKYWKIEGNADL
jgi:hypothetical protein